MEKIAELFSEHLTESQMEKLEKHQESVGLALEKDASGLGELVKDLAKRVIIPVAAGGIGAWGMGKLQEKREMERIKGLRKQIETNRAFMLQNRQNFAEKEKDFNKVFNDVAYIAPNVAANQMMIDKIMDKYGPHTEHDLEIMQLEALKSLDDKIQNVSHAQKRIMDATASGRHMMAQGAGEIFGSIPDSMIVDPINKWVEKKSSVDMTESMVKLAVSKASLLGMLGKRMGATAKKTIKNKGGQGLPGAPQERKILDYMKEFGEAIAPGLALASVPALGYMYYDNKRKRDREEQLQRTYNAIRKHPDLESLNSERMDEAFSALSEFAPSVASNPAAARMTMANLLSGEVIDPSTLKTLSDIERTQTSLREPTNILKEYALPAATIGATSMGLYKAYQDASKTRQERLSSDPYYQNTTR